jgi:hypothetical protein
MLKPGSTNYAGAEAYDQTLVHARRSDTLVTGSGHTGGGLRPLSRLELVEQQRFQAYQKEMSKEIQDYMKQHGTSVPMWKMQLITKRLRAKWDQPSHFIH